MKPNTSGKVVMGSRNMRKRRKNLRIESKYKIKLKIIINIS